MDNLNMMNSLFGDGGVVSKPVTSGKEDSIFFNPKAKKGQNNRYEAIIRFVPNLENLEECTISKYTVYCKNPDTAQGRTIDSPSTVGDDDPLSTMFFKIRGVEKENAAVAQQKYSENFKRHHYFYSLVQVLECKSEPSITGKFLIWRHGETINNKLNTEKQSPMEGVPAGQPFDLFKGRLFKVIVTLKENFDNYDQSMFFDIPYPSNCLRMLTPSTDDFGQIVNKQIAVTREMTQTEEGRQTIINYITSNAPKLSQCEYRPWDDNTRQYVNDMITLYSEKISLIQQGKSVNAMQQNATVQQTIQNQQMNPMAAQTQPMNGGMPSMGAILQQPQQPNFGIPTAQPSVQPQQPTFTAQPTAQPQSIQQPTVPSGLSFSDSAISTPTAPIGGAVNGLDMAAIDGLMGGATAAPQPSAQPTAQPANLANMLDGIM